MSLCFPLLNSVFCQYDLFEDEKLREFHFPTEKPGVKTVCAAVKEDLLAYSDTEKGLYVYEVQQNKKIGSFQMPHRISALHFVKKPNMALLVGDRSGNVFHLPVNRHGEMLHVNVTEKNSKDYLLLGHVSMLSHLDVCEEAGLLATGDRDEKIRISHYPQSYIIETFCLGHESYITQVKFLSNNLLLSGSGDGTLRLWCSRSGQCLQVLNCRDVRNALLASNKSVEVDQNNSDPSPLIPIKICVLGETVAVAFHKNPEVILLRQSLHGSELIPVTCLYHGSGDDILDIQSTPSASHYFFIVVNNSQEALKMWEVDSSTSQFHQKSKAFFQNSFPNFYERLAEQYLRMDETLKTLTKTSVETRGLDIYLQRKDARIQSKKARLNSQKELSKQQTSENVS